MLYKFITEYKKKLKKNYKYLYVITSVENNIPYGRRYFLNVDWHLAPFSDRRIASQTRHFYAKCNDILSDM